MLNSVSGGIMPPAGPVHWKMMFGWLFCAPSLSVTTDVLQSIAAGGPASTGGYAGRSSTMIVVSPKQPVSVSLTSRMNKPPELIVIGPGDVLINAPVLSNQA